MRFVFVVLSVNNFCYLLYTRWGFFDPAGNYDPSLAWDKQLILKNYNYSYQLVGIMICILLIGSLFIFRKYYRKTINWKWFRLVIGLYQIFTYLVYYVIMIVYLKVVLKTEWINANNPSRVRGLTEVIPLHLSSIHQLLSGVILIFPNRKLFELAAPSGLILPSLAIVTPVNSYWSLNNWFYYNYFILHGIIIFAYLYTYLYGLISQRYSGLLFRYALLWLIVMSIIAVIWNFIFKTNMLFVGPKGEKPWNIGGFSIGKWNTNYINGNYVWPFSWVVMSVLGVVIMSITHIILFYMYRIYYFDKQQNEIIRVTRSENRLFYNKYGLIYILLSFKLIFVSLRIIISDIEKYQLNEYYFPIY